MSFRGLRWVPGQADFTLCGASLRPCLPWGPCCTPMLLWDGGTAPWGLGLSVLYLAGPWLWWHSDFTWHRSWQLGAGSGHFPTPWQNLIAVRLAQPLRGEVSGGGATGSGVHWLGRAEK